jgi:hypothetical protein
MNGDGDSAWTPITVTITDPLEYVFLLRARCVRLFGEINVLSDENVLGQLTEDTDSLEGAERLLADFTAVRDALLRLRGEASCPDYPPRAAA